MRRCDASADQPLFPTPPTTAQGIELMLMRHAILRGFDGCAEAASESAGRLGGFGSLTASDSSYIVRLQDSSKVWTPLPGEQESITTQRGMWTQQSLFSSAFALKCPPQFKHQNFTVQVRQF